MGSGGPESAFTDSQNTKIALLEANQKHMGDTWTRMENSLVAINKALNEIKEEQALAKLSRQAASIDRKAFKKTVTGLEAKLDDLACKDDLDALGSRMQMLATKASLTALEVKVDGEIKTVAAIQKKQTEHDTFLNQWKGKAVVIVGVGAVLIGAAMKLVDGGLKAWLF
jgi:hypothetical protein